MLDRILTLDGQDRSRGHYNRSVNVGIENGDAKGRPYGRGVQCLRLLEIKTKFAYGL